VEEHIDHVDTYKKVRVNTAHPGKIIVMLYDEALKQINFSIEQLEEGAKSFDRVNSAILKAYDIITELSVALDMEKGGDIARQLRNLYDYFGAQLMQANIKKDAAILRGIQPLIADLRESWQKIMHVSPPHAEAQVSGIDIDG